MKSVELHDIRNVEEARLDLSPGLNVLVGRNAQGKTTFLETVGLLARGRSFRTEETRTLIRRGAAGLRARGTAVDGARQTDLEVELDGGARRLRVDGRDVTPRDYQGRLEVVVYSTDRLRVVRGPMRERRQYLDRGAAALWPSYRQIHRDFDRVLSQRNAALETGGRGLDAWDEGFAVLGGRLRARRAAYAAHLRAALGEAFRPAGEAYDVRVPEVAGEETARSALAAEMDSRRHDELRARRSLVGPHRDAVQMLVDGQDAAQVSSGQARSLLLALTLAAIEVYRRERASAPVALLDDIDSELDEERSAEVCRVASSGAQTLVTTAHAAWARALGESARRFRVCEGRVTAGES